MKEMKYACCFFSCFLGLNLLVSPSHADYKKPKNLGSIADPEDRAPALSNNKTGTSEPFKEIDTDFPSLTQTLRWEIVLTSKAYRINPNLRTRSDLVTALNKSIEQLCFRELQVTLFYQPPPQEAECVAMAKGLRDIDPLNPLIACLDSGIDDQECQNAYLTQITIDRIPNSIITDYSKKTGDKNSSSYSFHADLEVTLDAQKAQQTVRAIQNELTEINKAATRGTAMPANSLQKRLELLSRYLTVTCSQYRIVTFPKGIITSADSTRVRTRPSKNSRSSATKGSLEELLQKGPFSEQANADSSNEIKNRFRLVNKICLDALSYIQNQDANYAGIPCYRDGFTAPSCIQARRVKKPEAGRSQPQQVGNEGIERF